MGGGKQGKVPSAPKPKMTVTPVYPYDQAIADKRGSAKVSVFVGPDGSVFRTKIMDASEPEFGFAVAAAVEACTFQPGTDGKNPVISEIEVAEDFTPGKKDSPIDKGTAEIATRIRKGIFEPGSAKELDSRLRPKTTVSPVFPTAIRLQKLEGTAKVEVIIDKKGRAVLPRIVEASEPEFGWAAATAAQRWLFEPPTVKGKPVEVRVVIPFRFAPPEPTPEDPKG
jgi:TonB family protein